MPYYATTRTIVRHEIKRDMRTPDPSNLGASMDAARLAPDPRLDPLELSEKRCAIYAPAGTQFSPHLMARIERAMSRGFDVPEP